MINPGDLVKYVNPSKLLPNLDACLGRTGIVIKQMEPDSDEKFYMVFWGDIVSCIMEHNLSVIQSAH